MVVTLQGSQVDEGLTSATAKETRVVNDAQSSKPTPSKAANPSAEGNPPPLTVKAQNSMNLDPSLMGSPRKVVPNEELPSSTPKALALPPNAPEAYAPNEELPKQAAKVGQTQPPIDGTTDEIFHTLNLDYQLVTKKDGTEATIEEKVVFWLW